MAEAVAYTIRDLRFDHGETPVLRGIDLDFEPGRFHAVVGPNGSGKTTLLDLMAGLARPSSGSVLVNGEPAHTMRPAAMARLTALVPQRFDGDFPFTVRETVLMGRHPHIPRFSRPAAADLAAVDAAMAVMDVARLASRTLAELSGGERQRTVLARALAQTTPGLLLDEPTSSMDIRHTLATMAELGRLARDEGRSVVAVLHDLNLAATCCDRIVMLKGGTVHTQGDPATALTPETIRAVFGVRATVGHTAFGPMTIAYDPKDFT
ncbi:MAG: ABC transporter ATP-binding protein [Pseudomonadota bacterium]